MKGLTEHNKLHVKAWAWTLISLWSATILTSYIWNAYQVQTLLLEQARTELRANFFKDQTFRMWATKHGGVYVPVTATQKPDPYVAFLPERDVIAPSGKMLTLINPALMVRQFNELAKKKFGAEGHISSMAPINPINQADSWEQLAYGEFEKGVKEVTAITTIDDKPYLRLVRPMHMEASCLKCHAMQGYKAGDHDKEHINMIETIVAIAHNFNMEVVAEGVETNEQQELLYKMGCERLEGFLFSKPLPADEVFTILQNKVNI